MRILMVYANRYITPVPALPFGLCWVSAALEEAGNEVQVLDLVFSKNLEHDITDTIKKFQPQIIGISIRNLDSALRRQIIFFLDEIKTEIIDQIKKEFSGPIVLGGAAVGISAREILEFLDLEFAIRGDGEKAMVEFVNRIEKKRPLDGLGGLTRRKDGKIVEENPPWNVNDLSSLPKLRMDKYVDIKAYRDFKAPVQVQTKRGCELKCSYCTYRIIEGTTYRFRDPEHIADEIENYVKEAGVNHIVITDSISNMPLDYAKKTLKAIIARKLDVNLEITGVSPSAIDEELVGLFKEIKLKEIQMGAESGNDNILKNLGKNYTKEDIIRSGKLLQEAGIPAIWYLMLGAPGESEETLKETFETINLAASPWDLVLVVTAIRIYKDSELSRQVLEDHPGCTDDNFFRPVFYTPKDISLDAVRIISKKYALRNPNYLIPDEMQEIPRPALKFLTAVMKTFAPKHPWWRFIITVNKIQKFLGIFFLKRKILEIRERNNR
ncbi:MAG: radical SAM protein [Candidatus Aminicenantes bacterium]|nr:radical SAM protein [Candidatus Aminicenantes bacterium]